MWGDKMPICIYGELGFDWLINSDNMSINYRLGGAGLYASLAAAKQGTNVNFMTVYGQELNEYCISGWEALGISFEYAYFNPAYSLPKYIVTGFQRFGHKVSRPLTEVKLSLDYIPSLPEDCEGLLVFPVNHSLPKCLCETAYRNGIPIILDPKPNENSIEDAREVLHFIDILLVNEEEVKKLAQKSNISDAVDWVKAFGVNKIIVKRGIRGCIVYDKENIFKVEAYNSNAVCTLGSGDVFAGALLATYLRTKDLKYSATLASCVAADFIERLQPESVMNRVAAEHEMSLRKKISVPDTSDKSIYLAGPFFSMQEKAWVEKVCLILREAGFRVLSPSEENGIIRDDLSWEQRKIVFDADIRLLEQADFVVALLDHNDAGTYFEIGYAYKKGIPIYGLHTSQSKQNNMILFGCNKICKSTEELLGELYVSCK